MPKDGLLNKDQRGLLEKVIDGDADVVRSKIYVMGSQLADDKAKEVENQFAAEQKLVDEGNKVVEDMTKAVEDEIRELRTQHNDRVLAFVAKYAEEKGVTAKENPLGYGNPFYVGDVEEKTRDARNEARALQDKALGVLNNTVVELKREVLVAGITGGDAEDILKKLPTADKLLAKAVEVDDNTPILDSGSYSTAELTIGRGSRDNIPF